MKHKKPYTKKKPNKPTTINKKPINQIYNCMFLLTFAIQTKCSLLMPEFSHFLLPLVFQILPAMDARREPGATTTGKRAFSWLSVPVWVKGSRRRQLLLWVFIYHSSVPHFSSLKMPLCAVENAFGKRQLRPSLALKVCSAAPLRSMRI